MASWNKPSSPPNSSPSSSSSPSPSPFPSPSPSPSPPPSSTPSASSALSTSITKKLNTIPNYQHQQQQQTKIITHGATTTTVIPKAAPIILFGGISPANMSRSASPPASTKSTSPPQPSALSTSSTPSSPIQRSQTEATSPSALSPLTAVTKTRQSHAPSILPDDWQQDDDVSACSHCSTRFKLLKRRHHCRNCGLIFCSDCTKYRSTILAKSYPTPVRVCGRCFFALKQQGYDTSNETTVSRGSMDMKMQLQVTEQLAQSLSVENGQLRVVTASLDRIQLEQQRTIDILVKQDVQQQAIIKQMQGHIQQLQAQLQQYQSSSTTSPSPRMPSHSPPSIQSAITSTPHKDTRSRADAFMIQGATNDTPSIPTQRPATYSTSSLNTKFTNATFPTSHKHPTKPITTTTRPTSVTTTNNTNNDVYDSINSYYGFTGK